VTTVVRGIPVVRLYYNRTVFGALPWPGSGCPRALPPPRIVAELDCFLRPRTGSKRLGSNGLILAHPIAEANYQPTGGDDEQI